METSSSDPLETIEDLIVVSGIGDLPDTIYEKNQLIKIAFKHPEQFAFSLNFNYAYVKGFSDSDAGDYDRILITNKKVNRGDFIKASRTSSYIVTQDPYYKSPIKYFISIDIENSGNSDITETIKETLLRAWNYFEKIQVLLPKKKRKIRHYEGTTLEDFAPIALYLQRI